MGNHANKRAAAARYNAQFESLGAEITAAINHKIIKAGAKGKQAAKQAVKKSEIIRRRTINTVTAGLVVGFSAFVVLGQGVFYGG